ncbi:hypothetical protein K505DRAFT_371953 [Melanomma pulvis-pyrius CBS 109.77]|uniref:Uncharacterized protein n=1 Tax=Melanomma pulvis-pyrius CBS 109.77 TaxID=1314802 RepID=A0A6A6XQD3_9PLEO|nr:hypothetical protein K505DRAFT_371953 [Melanomma pulvis-pyrius CBS 109.77]
MPRAAPGAIIRRRGPAKSSARTGPYPQPSSGVPKSGNPGLPINEDKENASPKSNNNDNNSPVNLSADKESVPSNLPNSYRDIPLPEIAGEVPVYENATAIRRKLNKLLESKAMIPGSSKKWTQGSLSSELRAIAQNSTPVKTNQGVGNRGPSVASLRRFLKLSGSMGGGDSESYYFGNMLLEKLRIWNGEKKTKSRETAEKEYPNGRVRCDPDHMYYTCMVGEQMPSYQELANADRGPEIESSKRYPRAL